ncbi:MAG TPA: hypothetical protein VHY57_11730, partial [Rhizomicrobium sp.]|nr:hypothetical protein [Rhizomicrobium sp.]
MPEFLQVMQRGTLGSLAAEGRIAALAAHTADIGALDLFGQSEEGLGVGQSGIDALLIQIVIGDDGKASAFERCAQAGGER